MAKNLDAVIADSAPLARDTVLYRSMELWPATAEKLFPGGVPAQGFLFNDLGYQSTTLSKHIWAQGMNGIRRAEEGINVHLRITVPAGGKVLVMPKYLAEFEVVIPRGTTLRYTKVTKREIDAISPYTGKTRRAIIYEVEATIE